MLKRIDRLTDATITFAWSLDIDQIGDIVTALSDLIPACDDIADRLISSQSKRRKAIRKWHVKRSTIANVDHIERLQATLIELVAKAESILINGDVTGAYGTSVLIIERSLELLRRCRYQLRYDANGWLRFPPLAQRNAAYLAAWGHVDTMTMIC